MHGAVRNRPRPHVFGADARIRTADLRITNALLYRLSYIGAGGRLIICIVMAITKRRKIGTYGDDTR